MLLNKRNGRNRVLQSLIAVFALLCLVTACSDKPPAAQNAQNAQNAGESSQYYDMEFHRGDRDARPENTLYAYQYALENGAATIECDMQLTADGEIVLCHNPVLNPDITTDADGARVSANTHFVRDMTLEELRAFNVGHIDPSCEYYDLHSRSQVGTDAVIPTLRLDREEPSLWLGGISIHDYDDDPVKAAHALGIDHVSPYWEEITPALVEEAHSFGMKVVPWTVNYAEDMQTLYEMGVDGMITDRPWVLREFLLSKGETVRPAADIDLPYHLEPDHREISEEKAENGMDAAY